MLTVSSVFVPYILLRDIALTNESVIARSVLPYLLRNLHGARPRALRPCTVYIERNISEEGLEYAASRLVDVIS